MSSIKTSDPLALKILMTEDIYRVEKAETPQVEVMSSPIEKSQAPAHFNYLGENNKYFLVLVSEEENEVLSKSDLESLTNILNAKKLELRDVAILNHKKYQGVGFTELKTFFACSKCVLLGINPRDLDLGDVAGNKITDVDGVKVLASFSFGEMQADVNKKRIFWNEMKQL